MPHLHRKLSCFRHPGLVKWRVALDVRWRTACDALAPCKPHLKAFESNMRGCHALCSRLVILHPGLDPFFLS
jgi:hypothetical protein